MSAKEDLLRPGGRSDRGDKLEEAVAAYREAITLGAEYCRRLAEGWRWSTTTWVVTNEAIAAAKRLCELHSRDVLAPRRFDACTRPPDGARGGDGGSAGPHFD